MCEIGYGYVGLALRLFEGNMTSERYYMMRRYSEDIFKRGSQGLIYVELRSFNKIYIFVL